MIKWKVSLWAEINSECWAFIAYCLGWCDEALLAYRSDWDPIYDKRTNSLGNLIWLSWDPPCWLIINYLLELFFWHRRLCNKRSKGTQAFVLDVIYSIIVWQQTYYSLSKSLLYIILLKWCWVKIWISHYITYPTYFYTHFFHFKTQNVHHGECLWESVFCRRRYIYKCIYMNIIYIYIYI